MDKSKKIAVVMGGPSKEREVSLNTGKAILAALQEKGYNAVAVDLDPMRIVDQLKECGAEVVFNAIHGLYGEDGRLQGVLEMMGIPYTGSGVLASALGMDKFYTKHLYQNCHVPTPKCLYVDKKKDVDPKELILKELGIPCVVKPAAQGSSIGVTIVKSEDELDAALKESFSYGDRVLVEAYFKGKEVAGGVMQDEKGEAVAMPLVLIEPHTGSYDYHNKYTKGATTYTCPAPFDEETTKKLQKVAVDAYNALGCQGVARVDLMLADNGDCISLEVNTVPGMTATSLIPKAAAAMGLSFPDLCEKILLTAHC